MKTFKEAFNENKEKNIEKQENVQDKKVKTRDYNIDLIRVFACLAVIGFHLALTTYNVYEVGVDWSRLFTKAFLQDGVGLFFIITGFFIANGKTYSQVIKHTLKRVVLPAFICLCLCQFFNEWILNKDTFMNCLTNIDIGDVTAILTAVFRGDTHEALPIAAHLWYIFAYIEIMIFIPVFHLLCKPNNETKCARYVLMFMCFMNMLVKDIEKFYVSPIVHYFTVFSMIGPHMLMILIGYELYLYKDKIKEKKKLIIPIGLLCYVIVNVLRYKLESQYMIINHLVKEGAFMSWDTSIGVISTVIIFKVLYALDLKNMKFNKFLAFASSLTFGVYLIHFPLLAKIDLFKFEKICTIPYELLYMVLGILITFTVSGLMTYIITKCVKLIGKGIDKLKEKQQAA